MRKFTRRSFVAAGASLAAGSVLATSANASPVSVGLQCETTVDNQPVRHFAIVFSVRQSRWSELEPGGTSDVFTTKHGPYVVSVNTTTMKPDTGADAGTLQNFNPDTAFEGQTGTDALANETGRVFKWRVDSVVT